MNIEERISVVWWNWSWNRSNLRRHDEIAEKFAEKIRELQRINGELSKKLNEEDDDGENCSEKQ
ncbi:hypothetical protein A2U01_0099821, partial [Trifolium medium]|nr:hypothetical protein [Trifolium medium]